MTLCPVAIVAGCRKCPIVGMCPLKSVIGDYKPDDKPGTAAKSGAAGGGTKKPR